MGTPAVPASMSVLSTLRTIVDTPVSAELTALCCYAKLTDCPAPLQSQHDSRETHMVAPHAQSDELMSPVLLQSTVPPDLGRENATCGKNIPSLRLPAQSPEIYAQEQVDTTPKTTALALTPRDPAIARDTDDQTQHGTPAEHFQRHQSRMSLPKERASAPRRRHHHRR